MKHGASECWHSRPMVPASGAGKVLIHSLSGLLFIPGTSSGETKKWVVILVLVAEDLCHRFMCLGANCWSVVKGVFVSLLNLVWLFTHKCDVLVSYSWATWTGYPEGEDRWRVCADFFWEHIQVWNAFEVSLWVQIHVCKWFSNKDERPLEHL